MFSCGGLVGECESYGARNLTPEQLLPHQGIATIGENYLVDKPDL
jgi:hypothetical protein